jgi:NADPH-dependent glutamate synthase beta subunit-like oxidoreductase/glutamate synthase domain-containing protein 3/NAD-dependent dihydropyrimidine dehydrogenase PreA subunit
MFQMGVQHALTALEREMESKNFYKIWGKVDGVRLESRIIEEQIQRAVAAGERNVEINAFGQHGLGGRLWQAGAETVYVRITGHSGQRVGSLGFPNTKIEIMGPASDDVGWLNAGAEITVHGNAGNGVANAMAQGKIFVGGNIGARGMTMTKSNPRFDPPQIFVLGSVGDYFGEFMAGGIAVICGVNPQTPENVMGYRPLVGMVGGKIFFRGPCHGYSKADAIQIPMTEPEWRWLQENLSDFIEKIGRPELLRRLSIKEEWGLIRARLPHEKSGAGKRSVADFRANVWNKELGRGGLIGDLTAMEMGQIPLITTGVLRRFVPVWENEKYLAPCVGNCPTGIPVNQRWALVREGRIEEAIDLSLKYTPFAATVCGYLCPNLCMAGCTRKNALMTPIDITVLGKASIAAKMPEMPKPSGKKVAVLGGGPAGISVAWQLRRNGHEAVIYDPAKRLGGKIASVIPESRIPASVLESELDRVRAVIPHATLDARVTADQMEKLVQDHDYVVLATGAQKPRSLPVPGKERLVDSLEFLSQAKKNAIDPGKKVVIIGAGNVGCDVATEASRLGAEDILLIDIQEPASFGKEREDAEKAGARFRWPLFTKEITKEGVLLATGELLPADTVVISIGDAPETDFLPKSVALERGYVKVNDYYQTTDKKIFAIGDIVKPGLLTDAIGAGRKAAQAICDLFNGKPPELKPALIIDKGRISLEYFDSRTTGFKGTEHCGSQCASCGSCRDCGICVAICPQAAISRKENERGRFEYVADANRCIGCGFCEGACPCGIWSLSPNDPME